MKNQTNQRGFIKLIFLIVVLILILSYFGISLKNIAESDTGKANFGFVWDILLKIWDFIKAIWNKLLATPAKFVWDRLFVDVIWNSLVDNLSKLKVN